MFPIFQLLKKTTESFCPPFLGGLSIVSGWPWRPMHQPKCLLELQRAAYPTNAPWKFRVKLLNPNWSDRNCLFEGNFLLRSVFRDDWCMVSYWLPEIYRFNESFSCWDYTFDDFSKIFTDKVTLSYISEVRKGQWTVSKILRYPVWNPQTWYLDVPGSYEMVSKWVVTPDIPHHK